MGKTKKFFMYLVLTVASILSVFPLYYMFCASTNRSIDVIAGKLIPGTYLIDNFKALIAQQNLRLALCNSFRNATVLTILCLLVCSIAGYGFEIYHDKAKDAVFTVLLTAMMIPFAAIMIPMFRMFSKMGLLNNYLAIILPAMFQPLGVFLIRQQIQDFPQETLEAARLDGASEYRIYRSIVKPNLSSAIAAALILIFIDNWNIVDQAVIFLREPYQQPLSVYLCQILEEQPDIFYAASVFYAVPVLLIFLMGQDYLIQGISMSGVKA